MSRNNRTPPDAFAASRIRWHGLDSRQGNWQAQRDAAFAAAHASPPNRRERPGAGRRQRLPLLLQAPPGLSNPSKAKSAVVLAGRNSGSDPAVLPASRHPSTPSPSPRNRNLRRRLRRCFCSWQAAAQAEKEDPTPSNLHPPGHKAEKEDATPPGHSNFHSLIFTFLFFWIIFFKKKYRCPGHLYHFFVENPRYF